MEKLLTELRLKADNCDNTKEGRARKGAYVDCIVMLKQIKNCIPDVCVSLRQCSNCANLEKGNACDSCDSKLSNWVSNER
jgi:hypothetical protein